MDENGCSFMQTTVLYVAKVEWCEDRVLDGPASGEKGSKGRNELTSGNA